MSSTASPIVWVLLAVVVIVVVAVAAAAIARANRSKQLQERFGSEYDRAVEERGDRSAAEADLQQRSARRDRMHIEELEPSQREQYVEEWRTVQSRFVDEPQGALGEADRLIGRVMKDRGYPNLSYRQRVEDLSSDYADTLTNYRSAHDIATRAETGEASTEEQRQAMIQYRSLFAELVGSDRESDATL